MFIIQNHHTAVIVIVVALLVWFAYTRGYFGGSKAVMRKVNMSTVAPAIYGVDSPQVPFAPVGVASSPYQAAATPSTGGCGCGCTGKDLVNGAALDCPDDKNFDKPSCVKGSGPCACWA